jgi:hypothetical protein
MVDQPDHSWPVMLIGQDVDITIVVPSGTAIAMGDTKIQNISSNGLILVNVGTETSIISIIGKGKLSHVGFNFASSTDFVGSSTINYYVDGIKLLSIAIGAIDIANGLNVMYATPEISGYSLATVVNPKMALTQALYGAIGERAGYMAAGGFIAIPCEFGTSLEIKVKNNDLDIVGVSMIAVYGGYP